MFTETVENVGSIKKQVEKSCKRAKLLKTVRVG